MYAQCNLVSDNDTAPAGRGAQGRVEEQLRLRGGAQRVARPVMGLGGAKVRVPRRHSRRKPHARAGVYGDEAKPPPRIQLDACAYFDAPS